MSNAVIAIDGPAGAGKSTVAKAVAKALGFTYLDTGAMYRVVALLTLRSGYTKEDGEHAARIARNTNIQFIPGERQRVYANEEDLTDAIRTPEVSEAASALSTHSGLRQELVARQKAICRSGKVVLEGRDTTTVVCPEARLKVYLDASVEERARRRWKELESPPPLEEIQAQIAARDHRDRTREDSPLRIAEDALVIDTDNLSAEEVVEKILNEWRKAQ